MSESDDGSSATEMFGSSLTSNTSAMRCIAEGIIRMYMYVSVQYVHWSPALLCCAKCIMHVFISAFVNVDAAILSA